MSQPPSVSVGRRPGGRSSNPSISGDGKRIAFDSDATNLRDDGYPLDVYDDNGFTDVYLWEFNAPSGGRLRIVSLSVSEQYQANGNSSHPSISRDGEYVSFTSDATNQQFSNRDQNHAADVYVRDMAVPYRLQHLTLTWDFRQSNGDSNRSVISGDGRFVAFMSRANLVAADTDTTDDLYLFDRKKVGDPFTLVSRSFGQVIAPSISADGRYIAFQALSTRSTPGETRSEYDSIVYDRSTGTDTRVSRADGGSSEIGDNYFPSISGDGNSVAFTSTVQKSANGVIDADVFVSTPVSF